MRNYKLSDEEVKNLSKKKKNGNQLKSAKTKKQKETAKSSASIIESNNNNNSASPVLKINKLESMEELFNGGSSSQEKPIAVNKESNTTLIIEKPLTKTENNKRKLDSVDLSLLDDMIESTNTFTYEQQTVLPILSEHVESGISKIKIEQSFKRRNTMHIVGRKK